MVEQNNFGTIAPYYDLFELKSKKMYQYILDILTSYFTHYGVSTVLDLACGTGAQAIPLSKRGFRVTACDISPEMVQITRQKAKGIEMSVSQGDMRSSRFNKHDAAIAIFNSIGYLSRIGFISALDIIRSNIKEQGLFIFDNTNLDAIKAGAFSPGKVIDTAGEYRGIKYTRFFQSSINVESGLMTIDWQAYVQKGFQPVEEYAGTWNRQIYALDELEQLLSSKGFRVLEYFDRYGATFIKDKSYSVLVVAQKISSL